MLSAWGEAVEHNRDSHAQLTALREAFHKNPEGMRKAIHFAMGYQAYEAKKAPPAKPPSDPDHPASRKARLENLVRILEME